MRLVGSRLVPTLAPGAVSSGTMMVMVPPTTAPATHLVLAGADDPTVVTELDAPNNCTPSGGTITVAS